MERPRCVHCRNPIKEHQAAFGPREGDRTFHADCWKATHPDFTPPVVDRQVAPAEQRVAPLVERLPEPEPVADQAVQAVVEAVVEPVVEQRRPEPSSEQRDYEQRIASGGLAALLSPYVSGLPVQRATTETVPA